MNLLTVPEVAARLKVSRFSVYRLIHDGDLPMVSVRATTRVKEADLDAYIEKNTTKARNVT